MARKRNPRRIVLETLAGIKRLTSVLQSEWTVTSTVHDFPGGPRDNAVRRDREANEYPENRAEYWLDLARQAAVLERQAATLKKMADANFKSLQRPDRYAPCGCTRLTFYSSTAIQHGDECLDGKTGYEVEKSR